MRKASLLLLCLLCLLLSGCGTSETAAIPADAAPAKVIAESTSPLPSDDAAPEIDLTSMSSTMVYSYVYNMMSTPDEFVGQRFKLQGLYDEILVESTNQTYHYVVIADATACCAQGLEFVLTGENPTYPQPGGSIEISGLFTVYEEGGYLYVCIVADSIRTV